MPASLVGHLLEKAREDEARDAAFLREHLVFFELVIGLGRGAGTYLFPLVVPPKASSIEERALVQYTGTASGGLAVEENGCNRRPIELSGSYGFEPKAHRIPPSWDAAMESAEASHARRSSRWAVSKLSGQRHLEYLQDVFRLYWDRKHDPELSEGTRLIYHCPREGEHFVVIPEYFRAERSVESPVGSPDWEIRMSAIAPSKDVHADFSPDKGLLDSIRDTMQRIRAGIDLIQAGINDIKSVIAEVRQTIAGIDAWINSALGLIDAGAAVLESGAQLTGAMIARARSLYTNFETFAEQFEDSDLFRHVRAAMYDVADGAASIAAFSPENDEETAQRQPTALPADGVASIEDLNNASRFPGDDLRTRARAADQAVRPTFTGVIDVEVRITDTIETIATRHTGNPSDWREIARLNGLVEPFISSSGLPGTVAPGQRILVPTRGTPSSARRLAANTKASSGASVEARLFGTDFMWVQLAGTDLYGFAVSDSGDDIRTVTGRACLKQGLEVRVRTERGTDSLYPNLGRERTVGFNLGSIAEQEMAHLRILDTVQADPRIQSARLVVARRGATDDSLATGVRVTPIGLSSPVNIDIPAIAARAA